MSKDQAIEFLTKEGITAAAVEHPEFPAQWVLEFLENLDQTTEFKEYYREFISVNFK